MNAQNELLDHLPGLRRYARALVNNRELAEDLVQDTLERALSRLSLFKEGTDMRAWLFTIMHNVFANHVRQSSSRPVHLSVDDDAEWVSFAYLSVGGNQLPMLEVRDFDDALQRLPLDQRQVVLLIGLEEMSYIEVALALDVPLGTVMSRLSRGRERLRSLMSGTGAVRPEPLRPPIVADPAASGYPSTEESCAPRYAE
jgi:RNA polymerase sigma-70 factor (ECF subfamily)